MKLIKCCAVLMCCSIMVGVSDVDAARIRAVRMPTTRIKVSPPARPSVKPQTSQRTQQSNRNTNTNVNASTKPKESPANNTPQTITKTTNNVEYNSSGGFVSNTLSTATGVVLGSAVMNAFASDNDTKQDPQDKKDQDINRPIENNQNNQKPVPDVVISGPNN